MEPRRRTLNIRGAGYYRRSNYSATDRRWLITVRQDDAWSCSDDLVLDLQALLLELLQCVIAGIRLASRLHHLGVRLRVLVDQ